LIGDLISFLGDVKGVTLWLFISGIGIGFLILVVTYFIICVRVWRERKEVSQIIRFLPPQYLVLNRGLKIYLFQNSKELGRLLKDIEKKKFED
jgi:hypothetical protein